LSAPCPLFGFRVTFRSHSDLTESLAALLEARGLIAESDRASLIVSSEAGQATESDRQAVLEWAREHPAATIEVGPLGDLRDTD